MYIYILEEQVKVTLVPTKTWGVRTSNFIMLYVRLSEGAMRFINMNHKASETTHYI